MKIKKILIYNFKNFRHKTVIDFSEDITFLVGPNGFGKTTIFDAIELGLTGKLSRINKVTGENIIYNKPFFQNEIGSPVVIKLWLEKKRGDQFVIVRKLENDSTDGKKVYAPIKSTSQFKLFRQDEVDDTNFIEIDNIRLSDLTQSSIDEFLGVKGKYEIEKIFNLFNYIQQEETTFFLKQTEQERSDSLSFLVKTDEIEEKIEKIDKITRAINSKLDNLQVTQRTLIQRNLADVLYERLFTHHEFDFDKQAPFSSENLDQLTTFQATVQSIINFKQNFSVSEYKKRIERDQKKQEITNNRNVEQALYYSILSPIINESVSKWQGEKYTLNNLILFEYTLLENYLQSFDVIIRENKRRKELNQYLTNLSKDINQMIVQSFDYVQGDSLANDFESLKQQFGQYQNLRGQANQIDKNLSDLKQLRINLANQFNELRQHHHIVEDNKCPFCNSQFKSFEDLVKSYVDYENYLTSISSQSSQNLQVIQSSLASSIQLVKQKITDEINSLRTDIDDGLLDKLHELHDKYEGYFPNINGFKTFIQPYTAISPYSLGSLELEVYNRQYQSNLQEFRSKLVVDDDIYPLVDVNNQEIANIFEKLRSKVPELQLESYQLNQMLNQKISKSMLDTRLSELKQGINSAIDTRYAINENLLMDTENIFPMYFQNDVKLLESISIEALERKKLYLNKQHNLVQNQRFQDLSHQIDILEKTEVRLKELNMVYKEEVRQFKISIVKQLRIPFFIYSAKMLQNYQQGMGIFLTYKKTSEDDATKKMIIRFKSDSSNDHDAMNQLSTGQLAVVSLAFTLSLNTMFKLSDNLNFLMIDDPIQDMDAMNVLSFIEILRHGIIDRYQIILSTYSDHNALFMGYKFANSNSQVDINYKNVRELQI
ncbi:AAA family ATPase [Streptococcus equi]|uniref:AAA family ATPase n=3 Tax=Streptococcus equi TaxID=1336 RepID=UPI001E29922E|nr:AAA family ATPase [Streptococcus equi]MCD3402883.1 AAA family ATPase [Streptococcus equi subsp. zooepidemicus]MCD3441673.1 AAA family ATPase [Streptococcus equi subsp. zooepidemicus]